MCPCLCAENTVSVFTFDWLKGVQILAFDVVPNCLIIGVNGCIKQFPYFFCAIESTRGACD